MAEDPIGGIIGGLKNTGAATAVEFPRLGAAPRTNSTLLKGGEELV